MVASTVCLCSSLPILLHGVPIIVAHQLQKSSPQHPPCRLSSVSLPRMHRLLPSRLRPRATYLVFRSDENARFQSVEAGLKADLKLAKEERALLRAENEKLVTKVHPIHSLWVVSCRVLHDRC